MKPETMKLQMTITPQDRFSTGDEIRCAGASAEDRVLELCRVEGNYCEMDSDLGGVIRYPAEEFEFFAHLSEMSESLAN